MHINQLSQDAGVLICGHGSRAKIAEREFSLLAKGLRARFPELKVEYGFLEYSAPNIHMALDRLVEQGVKKIYAVPGMLFAATHARNDIPSVLTTYKEKHPGLEIEYGKELGLHQEMINAFQARILEAATGSTELPLSGSLYDTMLVTVGRGTSVTEANAEAAKLTRIVCENLGFGWAETVYSGVTYPSVGRGLEMAVKLGFKKIVVAPYFLFGGRLIDRIHGYIDKVAAENPDITFLKADYLRDQSHVINTFIERINDTINGDVTNASNGVSLMQDFKDRLARGEVNVHHHHAEFQPEDKEFQPEDKKFQPEDKKLQPEITDPLDDEASPTHTHSHKHSHAQKHSHSHAPYKHIGHPQGPRTMINDNICCCFMGQFPQHIIDEEKAIKGELPGTPSCKRS
ncbi:MAG: sirohydrochlorin cobaltochelatase [Candidatus Endobugula sp.]|jgi:sirohydrochlorin cobaltochelatase